ncbi:LLM class flavin-dependent oxidoreductase [Nakamurella flava]|uniref:LLM class flavin-dependent oxidoreductase n=1 Tax=Nakamurella flava TaxID=2576308 RepID=UPI00197B33D6|nr:LLM class flavin-dependent oxidoreductase [Nakamurella flava]
MPVPGAPLRSLGFLTMGLFDPADPRPGHEATLRMIERGEELGFDSAWVRHRHVQHGISSPVAVLAAASQRTSRIALGTAVTPLGWENPLRLAEDWATLDVLSGGRFHGGFSVGPPMQWDAVRDALYPDTADVEDFGYGRVERLLRCLRGERVSQFEGTRGIEVFSARVEPHSPGLPARLWYGAASARSAAWAGEHGLNLLMSSVVRAEPDDAAPDFGAIQAGHVQAYRDARAAAGLSGTGRISQGLVVIPTDGATADQRERYQAYADARLPRTREPQGPGGLLFAPDLVGPAEDIAARLHAHPGFRLVDEVAFALPFTFAPADYDQIITDIATRLGPALGWRPGG